eukprot:6362888-Prymnesium_polylepis.1
MAPTPWPYDAPLACPSAECSWLYSRAGCARQSPFCPVTSALLTVTARLSSPLLAESPALDVLRPIPANETAVLTAEIRRAGAARTAGILGLGATRELMFPDAPRFSSRQLGIFAF